MLTDLWQDNKWVVPAFGVVVGAGTYFVAGVTWTLVFGGVVGAFVVASVFRSYYLLRQAVAAGGVDGLSGVTSEPGPTSSAPGPAGPATAAPSYAQTEPGTEGDDEHDEPAGAGEFGDDRSEDGEGGDEPEPEADDEEQPDEAAFDELSTRFLAQRAARTGATWDVRRYTDGLLEHARSQGEEDLVDLEAEQLALLAQAGEGGALALLKRYASDHPERDEPINWLATALDHMNEPGLAAAEIAARVEGVADTRERAALIVRQVGFLRDAGDLSGSIECAGRAIEPPPESVDDLARLVGQLSRSLYESDQKAAAFVAAEKALSLDPTQSGLRFFLAYRYGEQGWTDLSMIHYRKLADGPNATSSYLNNLGVAYARLGMPGLSSDKYKQAADLGSALAAGNYAREAVKAGLLGAGEGAIEQGQKADPTNELLASAGASLRAARRAEGAAEEKIRLEAAQVQDALRQMGASTEAASPAGTWDFDGDIQPMTFEEQGDGSFEASGDIDRVVLTPQASGGWQVEWDGEYSGTGPAVITSKEFVAVLQSGQGRTAVVRATRNTTFRLDEDHQDEGPVDGE